jgi:hypothetical protein
MPIPNTTVPWGQPMPPPNNGGGVGGGGGQGYQQGSPFRQTIMGLPQMSPPYQPPPPPPPQPSYADHQMGTGQRRRFPLGMTVAVLIVALGAMVLYTFYHRQGQLRIDVSPTGATVAVDGVTLKGLMPITLDKAPGTYRVTAVQDGYGKEERRVEVEPGNLAKVRIDLRPSPDTGFELTSDPPGQLVWMDGIPFTGVDAAGPQARTDFKATRVPPGRHLLEIKGDPRFRPWRHEFYQEPGRLIPIRASLLPEAGAGHFVGPAVSTRAPVESPAPKPAPEPAAPAIAPRPATASPPPVNVPRPAPTASAPPAATGTPKPAGSSGATGAGPGGAAGSSGAVARAAGTAASASKPPSPTPPAAKPAEPARPRPPVARPAVAETAKPAGEAAAGGACAVTIGSKPWAEVWIDGKNTTKLTPLVDFKLPCGKHKITVKNPDVEKEKSETVTIRAGEKWKKIFQLLDDE